MLPLLFWIKQNQFTLSSMPVVSHGSAYEIICYLFDASIVINNTGHKGLKFMNCVIFCGVIQGEHSSWLLDAPEKKALLSGQDGSLYIKELCQLRGNND